MLFRAWLSSSRHLLPVASRACYRSITTKIDLKHTPVADAIRQLETDAGRLLKVVKNKIGARTEALKKLEGQMDLMQSPDNIENLRIAKELEPLQAAWDKYDVIKQTIAETATLLTDPDPAMRSLAAKEQSELFSTLSNQLSTSFPALLVPKSSSAQHFALMELKAGVGGDEACLFVADLLRMYSRLAEEYGWPVEIISKEYTEGGKGVRGAVLETKGQGAYDTLRWESGVHRVQRVPETEKSGRLHTSTVAVVVLPLVQEGDSSNSENLYDMKDIRIDVMRSRGAGGQHVNKTESAVRVTHIPTGIVVSMQDDRSQHRNRAKAFQILSARLLDRKMQREMLERRSVRRALVRGADRSEKVRTYNWPQGRVTDHRINLTVNNLDEVLEGNGLGIFIDALKTDHETALMEELLEE